MAGQRIRINETGWQSDVLTRMMSGHNTTDEGTIIEGSGTGFYWVEFDRHGGGEPVGYNVLAEEFDVIEDVVTLRLDDATIEALVDIISGPHGGKGNLLDETREAIRKLDVRR